MKKFILIGAVLSLVFFFSVIAANAQQTIRQYKTEIPFDFNVGQKSHPAGNYVIKISKLSLNNMALTLENEQKNIVQTMFARGNSDTTKDEPHLVFARLGGKRFLSEIVMGDMELSIGKTKNFERILKARGPSETSKKDASVALK